MIPLLLSLSALAVETPIVPTGGTWSYLDTGVDPGPGWADPAFDDTAWATGPAPLGYGIYDAATVLDYGADPLNKPITVWFRSEVTVSGAAALTGLVLTLRVDDGAVVYLNGVEVHRRNLPAGPIAATTLATSPVVGAVSYDYERIVLDPADLVEGINTVAVEVHQDSPSSFDLALDAALDGYDGATAVVRGPYLQQTTDDRTIVRWRTLGPSDSTVWYGSAPGALATRVDVAGSTLEHEVELVGLGPSAAWHYGVGSSADGVLAGDDADHVFTTLPPPGTRQPLRIWALGDSGTADDNARAVRDGYLTWSGGAPPDVWLMLGDNAYNSGTDAEYQAAVFDIYPDMLRKVALWSTLGNHDGYSASSLTQTGPYYDIFSLPTAGEAGGEPSGTEAYYSFDVGNVHFVCLDSDGSDRSVGGAMLTWLEADLAATTADWVVAFWHHPPYSKGSHDSDRELKLVDMRANALPILEAWGVDLVLGGHSHSYERSELVDGHYGASDTLVDTMVLDDSPGDPASPYRKPTAGMGPNEGAVYVVAGSSGKVSGGSLDHPVMEVSLAALGSLVLDVDGDRLDGSFLGDDGTVLDSFAIDKGVTAIVQLTGPRDGEEGELLMWSALAVHPDGTEVASYDWTFGDGAVGSGASTSHAYTADGTYPVTLTVLDVAGEPVVRTFDVVIENLPPDLDPVTPPTVAEGSPLTLTATATDRGGDAMTWTWDVGDGIVLDGQTVEHTWDDDGVYPVTVTVTDADGAASASDIDVTVTNEAPTATVTFAPAAEGAPVQLEAVGVDPGVLDVISYAWDDGTTAADGPVFVTTFPDDGAHVVTLTVSDDDGGSTVHEVIVDVANAPPVIEALAIAESAWEGDPVTLVAAGSDPGQDVIGWSWDFGDEMSASGDEVIHAWRDDGVYTVTVTADDGEGGSTTATHPMIVANLPPVLGPIVVQGALVEGAPVTLSASATDPGADDEVTVSWEVLPVASGSSGVTGYGSTGGSGSPAGDGILELPLPEGTFTVTVTAADDDGAGESASLELTVVNGAPAFTDPEAQPPGSALPGAEYRWTAGAVDPGGDPLSWHLDGPEGATVDGGLVTWTPRARDAGAAHDFVLTVADDAGAAASRSWSVVVEDRGCGCATGGGGSGGGPVGGGWLALVGLVAVGRRRRTSARARLADPGLPSTPTKLEVEGVRR